MQSSTPGNGAVPSCTTPHRSRMNPSYSGISARMPSTRRIDMSDLPILFREDCREVPPLVQDAHDVDVVVSDPIEDRIGTGDRRAQPRDQLVPSTPTKRARTDPRCDPMYSRSRLSATSGDAMRL